MTTVTNAFDFNIGFNLKKRSLEPRDGNNKPKLSLSDLTSIFNAGATWSWSKSYSNSTSTSNTKPRIDANKCGYWTFVPYYVELVTKLFSLEKSTGCIADIGPRTCGTLTWAESIPFNAVGTGGHCGSPQTIENWCQKTPMVGSNGEPLGRTIFVATNCIQTERILPFCWQDAVYCFDGVSSNKTLAEDFRNAFRDYDINGEMLSSVRYWCEHNTPDTGYTEGETLSGCPPGLPLGIPSTPLRR